MIAFLIELENRVDAAADVTEAIAQSIRPALGSLAFRLTGEESAGG